LSVIVVSMQIKVVLMSHTMNWINWAMIVISMMGYVFFCYVYGLVPSIEDWYHVLEFSFNTVSFLPG